MGRWNITARRKMKTLKNVILVSLLLLGFSAFPAKSLAQSYETVVGSVSGSVDAGEAFELYRSSADSFRDFLSGWKDIGWKDRRRTYSYSEIYDLCLEEAKRQYGNYYPNLYLKNVHYYFKDEGLEDIEYYSQEIGSSTQYRKKERVKRVYYYSASVVVDQ